MRALFCTIPYHTIPYYTYSQGATLKLYPLMLVGRLLFGAGNGSLSITQNKFTAYWFDGKELAMAFGMYVCMHVCILLIVYHLFVTQCPENIFPAFSDVPCHLNMSANCA